MEITAVAALTGIASTALYSCVASPVVRLDAACKRADTATKIGKETLKQIPTLTPRNQKELCNAKDQVDALWETKLDAAYMRARLADGSFAEKYFKPDYSCIKEDGEVLTLSQVEQKTRTYEQQVLNTSYKTKELRQGELEAAQMGQRRQAVQPTQFQVQRSFDVDLEAGLSRR